MTENCTVREKERKRGRVLTVDGGCTASRGVGGEPTCHTLGVGLSRDEGSGTGDEEDGAELHSVLMLPGWWVERVAGVNCSSTKELKERWESKKN